MKCCINIYYRILKCLGLLPLTYDKNAQGYVLRGGLLFYLMHSISQTIFVGAFAVLIVQRELFLGDGTMENDSLTGSYYDYFLLLTAAATQILLNAWLLMLQRKHFYIIKQCQVLSTEFLGSSAMEQRDISKGLLIVFTSVCLVYILNAYQTYVSFGATFNMILLPNVTYILRCVLTSFLLIFYICIITTIRNLLNHIATSIPLLFEKPGRLSTYNMEHLQKLLSLHDKLLLLCSEDISTTYGVVLLLSALFGTLDITSSIYSMAVSSNIYYRNRSIVYVLIESAVWLLPTLLFLTMALVCNNIGEAANKTSKILSKVPRTGTGIEKMIEKFLLKNLRPKPILTAYGFFSLDKSTLFKLFTAIFTYMVILVQFKEMESSTKYMTEKI